jgi:hypothetical protein
MTCALQQTTAPADTSDRTERIARVNDRARMGFDRRARIVMTSGLLRHSRRARIGGNRSWRRCV